jgi:hypothetical protein
MVSNEICTIVLFFRATKQIDFDQLLEAGQKCGPLSGFGKKGAKGGKGIGGAFALPPQALIAIAVAVATTIIAGGLVYYFGTRETDEAKSKNFRFIGVTMVFTAISFSLIVLPWYAILGLVFCGLVGALAMALLSQDALIRSQSLVAFFMFYTLFVVFTGNLGFLASTLVGISVGSYFYSYAGRVGLTETQKYNNLFLGSLVTLPSVALLIVAGKAIQVRGLF